jgi:hypothetical protein
VAGGEQFERGRFFLAAPAHGIGAAGAEVAAGGRVDDLGLDGDVQGGDRFVAEDRFGIQGECAGDPDALALSSRELVRVAGALKHLGIWDRNPPYLRRVKARPPPKATGPPQVQEYSIDYSVSKLPESTPRRLSGGSDNWLAEGRDFSVIDPVYPEACPP